MKQLFEFAGYPVPEQVKLFRITDDLSIAACHVYMEAQIFAPDSRFFIFHAYVYQVIVMVVGMRFAVSVNVSAQNCVRIWVSLALNLPSSVTKNVLVLCCGD